VFRSDMSTQILKALDSEIGSLEKRLGALRTARAALAGGGLVGRGRTARMRAGKGRRRKFNAAQRADISRRMKALWAKRKAGKK